MRADCPGNMAIRCNREIDMKNAFKFTTIISLAALGACTSMETTSESFGKSVRQNIAAQYVTPTDEQKQNTFIRPDAQRSSAARQRYKADDVEEPKDLSTTKGD